MVRLAGVRKRYRGRGEVLAGIDLEVEPGRPVVVVGGNGAGKSTLLRIAAGCTSPTAGSVSGRPPVVGFLPGSFPTTSRLSVRSYLRHLARVHGAPADLAAARAAELLDALAFTGDRDAPLAHLSTGNAQKVGLVQALSCGAGLLVLDEPWSGLDAVAAAALDRWLAAEVAAGATLLLADHTGRAGRLPDVRVFRMADGLLVPETVPPRQAVGHTLVELRCPGDPADALRVLPPVVEHWRGPSLLRVRVSTDSGDALLAAALAQGCSVLDVRREDPPEDAR